MQSFFTSINTTNRELVIRGRLVKGAAAIIVAAVLTVLSLMATQILPSSTTTIISLFGVLVASAVVFWMAHRGAVISAGIVLSVAIVASNMFSGGNSLSEWIDGLTSYSHLIPVMIGGMVVGSSAVLWLGVLPLVAFGLLAATGSDTNSLLVPTILVVMITGLVWLIIRTLEGSLAEVRGQMHMSQAAQHSLEAQQQDLIAANQNLVSTNEQMTSLLELVRDLEAPLLPVLDGVQILPLVGHIDTRRAERITATVLQSVHEQRTNVLIIDLTGVSVVDTAVVQWLGRMSDAVRLLGVKSLITGMNAEIAHTIVQQGVQLQGVQSVGRLQDGIGLVMRERQELEASSLQPAVNVQPHTNGKIPAKPLR